MQYRRAIAYVSLIAAALIFLGAGLYFFQRDRSNPTEIKSKETVVAKTFEDKLLGVKLSIPESYQQRADTPPSANQKNALPAKNFERNNPQGFLTVRYEAGLSKPANLLKRSLVEHVEAEIRQFFKVKYKDYKEVSLGRTKVAGRESVEHIFQYILDGKPIKAKLLVVPFDNDSAYYLILQAHKDRYDQVAKDLDTVSRTIQINGPIKQ